MNSEFWDWPLEWDSPEEVVVAPSHDGGVRSVPATFKLVEDAVVLIERAQFRPEVLVDSVGLNRLGLHMQVPHLDGEIVPANNNKMSIKALQGHKV